MEFCNVIVIDTTGQQIENYLFSAETRPAVKELAVECFIRLLKTPSVTFNESSRFTESRLRQIVEDEFFEEKVIGRRVFISWPVVDNNCDALIKTPT